MLHEFVSVNRDAIATRTGDKRNNRGLPPFSGNDVAAAGIREFLTQLTEALRLETTATPAGRDAIASRAARHGESLLALGLNVSQVVHVYGDICQAITEMTIEQQAPITTEEFHTLNDCLDTAIAAATMEHGRLIAASTSRAETQRLGQTAHELRGALHTARLAFAALRAGLGEIDGNAGDVLERSLVRCGQMVEDAIAAVRLALVQPNTERVGLGAFLHELALAGQLEAESRQIRFTLDPVDPDLSVDVDRALLTSAVMNLLQNAFKYSRGGGEVVLRGLADDTRVCIEVEDECGGLPHIQRDPFEAFGERRGHDRSGLGLGLSIARAAVSANGGDIRIRNLPGKGCIFVVEMPAARSSVVQYDA